MIGLTLICISAAITGLSYINTMYHIATAHREEEEEEIELMYHLKSE